MSAYSRQTYSNLHTPVIPVMVTGWQRGWTTRYGDEVATYLGVRPAEGVTLSAALVPTQITDELRHRERGYDFTPVERDAIRLLRPGAAESELEAARFWIVVNREQIHADETHPIPQSYIDTCLLGCLETGGREMAEHFIDSTERRTNCTDRHAHRRVQYPAQVSELAAEISPGLQFGNSSEREL